MIIAPYLSTEADLGFIVKVESVAAGFESPAAENTSPVGGGDAQA